jgi:tripartite ATP-independent transporter DctM subunit
MVTLLLVMMVLIALGMPIAYAMLAPTAMYFVFAGLPEDIFIQRVVSSTESFPLMSIPFFVLAGDIMHRGGIARRILDVASVSVGHLHGGLAQVSVLSGTLLGAISGSATADTAILAKTIAPQMVREGYPKGFAAVSAACSGILAPIIPPSIMLILYGLVAEVSIGRLFIAGVGPGLVMAALMMMANTLAIRRHALPIAKRRRATFAEFVTAFRAGFWALLFPVLIWVGLRAGFFTPTELGAFVALYCFVISVFVYRELSLRDLPGILKESATLTAVVLLILAAGGALNYAVAWERLPQAITSAILGVTHEKFWILAIVNVLLLALGTLMEGPPLLVILTPILVPVMHAVGVDPVHFGIIITLNLTLGAIHPPVGALIFVACSVVDCSVGEFMRYFWIIFGFLIASLILITYVPELSLWLPRLVYGS